jgi:hypothetical protein
MSVQDVHVVFDKQFLDPCDGRPIPLPITRHNFRRQTLAPRLLANFRMGRVGIAEYSEDTVATLLNQVPGQRHEHVFHAVVALAADEEENGHFFLGISFLA